MILLVNRNVLSVFIYLLVNVHRLQVVDMASLNPLGRLRHCLQH